MMNTIISFFALGALGFWLLVIGFLIAAFFAAEKQSFFAATILGLVLVGTYGDNVPLYYWKYIAICSIVYFVAGAFFSVWRWRCFIQSVISAQSNPAEISKWTIMPKSHKDKIISWILFWPISLAWNFVGDAAKTIYNSLEGVYQGIANSALEKALKNQKQLEDK